VASIQKPYPLKGKMPTNAATVQILQKFFGHHEDILLAFLFGSVAKGQPHSDSDVDIAFLSEIRLDIYQANDIREEMGSLFKREVDLVLLNTASPVLRMQVLRKGILAFSRDPRYFSRFYSETVNQYDDLKRVRRECEDRILQGRIYA
jgi:predicted nucleotidyltransferase